MSQSSHKTSAQYLPQIGERNDKKIVRRKTFTQSFNLPQARAGQVSVLTSSSAKHSASVPNTPPGHVLEQESSSPPHVSVAQSSRVQSTTK